mmetsp:Transcript_7341/g.10851  ORF Transcript_7341/g.10851 Transcript_7341/m.10851 type:complete len:96 (+) Transcript_7341:400-687(+)
MTGKRWHQATEQYSANTIKNQVKNETSIKKTTAGVRERKRLVWFSYRKERQCHLLLTNRMFANYRTSQIQEMSEMDPHALQLDLPRSPIDLQYHP